MLRPSSKRVRRTIQGTTGWLKSFWFLRESWSVSSWKLFLHTWKRTRCLGIAAWISQGLITPDDLFAICGEMTESVDGRRAVDIWPWLQEGFDMVSLSILIFKLGQYSLDRLTARSVRNWLTHQAPSVAVNGSYTALRIVTEFLWALSWDLAHLASLSKTWRRWLSTLLSSLEVPQNWESQSTSLGAMSPSRSTWTGWRNRPTRTSWIQQMLNAKSCSWAGPNLHWYRLGIHWVGSDWLGCCWKWSGDSDGQWAEHKPAMSPGSGRG